MTAAYRETKPAISRRAARATAETRSLKMEHAFYLSGKDYLTEQEAAHYVCVSLSQFRKSRRTTASSPSASWASSYIVAATFRP